MPTAVGLAILSDQAVALYPSGEFADSSIVLRILAVGFCFLSMASVSATLLTGGGKMRTIVVGYVIALAGQAVANALLIPRYGAVGAAAGTVGAYVLLAIVLMGALRTLGVKVPLGAMLGHLAATALMGAVVLATRHLPLPIPVGLGGLVYLLVLMAVSSGSSLERRLITEVIARLRRRREVGLG
jgi:O-antigen/teichoic acid export membrane protein